MLRAADRRSPLKGQPFRGVERHVNSLHLRLV